MILWGMGALLETQGVRVFRGRWALPKRVTEALASLRRLPAALAGLGARPVDALCCPAVGCMHLRSPPPARPARFTVHC